MRLDLLLIATDFFYLIDLRCPYWLFWDVLPEQVNDFVAQ